MKKMTKDALALYAVTHGQWVREGYSLEDQLRDALEGGVTCVQFREKTLEGQALLEQGQRLLEICRGYSVPFIVNDSLDFALTLGADGVHLGQKDMSVAKAREILAEKKVDMIVGATARTVEQAVLAQEMGANYLGSGAVFGTSTKLDAVPMSRETLMMICSSVEIPVVGIGGIALENLPLLSGSGISGVALVSTIFAAENILETCRNLRKVLDTVL